MPAADKLAFWRDTASDFGAQLIDKMLDPRAERETLRAHGRQELGQMLEITQLAPDRSQTVIEIGCGMGRLSYALAEHFGFVLGLDVSPAFIAQARADNDLHNLDYELIDGQQLDPQRLSCCDVVFAYEVFHYLAADTLIQYFRDAHRLLRPGGQLVFEWNALPFPWKARCTGLLRQLLYRLGVRNWRGWPTNPGFQRVVHPAGWVRQTLEELGYRIDRAVLHELRQAWIVATRLD